MSDRTVPAAVQPETRMEGPGTFQGRSPWAQTLRRFSRNRGAVAGATMIVLIVVVAVLAPILAPYEATKQDLSLALRPVSGAHWLGTDEMGRDILSRILMGSRNTLTTSLAAVALGATLGAIVGMLSGYYGRWVDMLLMRSLDLLLALPAVLLALAIISMLGVGLQNLAIAIAVYSVPIYSRLSRGSTLTVRQQEYVQAAMAAGATDLRIIGKHVFPNIVAPLIVQTSLHLATAILLVCGLSFLGMGAQPPTPEWGAMLSSGRNYLATSPHIATFPGVAIMLVALGFNLMGDGLRDALDPRLKQ